MPEISVATMKQCINQVCSKDARGARNKDEGLGKRMTKFWKETFSKYHPNLLHGKGISHVKQLLADQMLECILTDVKTNFESRFRKVHVVLHHLTKDQETRKPNKREN